ncbi:MAG: hypothetical protein ABJE10_16335 [bacterium]
MSDELPRRRSLDSLKKEAKRWLDELRNNVDDARARFQRALPDAPATPTLRDVQHALAREQGFHGWTELKNRVAEWNAESIAAHEYDEMAAALLDAYRTGTPEAMERHWHFTWHRRGWRGMRTYVQLDLGKRLTGPHDDVEITIDDARYLVAIEHGFESWSALKTYIAARPSRDAVAAKPVRVFSTLENGRSIGARGMTTLRVWNAVIAALSHHASAGLNAEGAMTDAALRDVSRIPTITTLELSGSKGVTDEGIRHLAQLPHLRHLDLSGTAITDRALDVLRKLPELETIALSMTQVTDVGIAQLSHCEQLQRVDLQWTHTGDDAIRALAGKHKLSHFKSGNGVTDTGLALLHDLPVFKSWHGGDATMALLSYDAEPNYLLLRGTFTDRGMQSLEGLDGLFALNIDASELALTSAALATLVKLPQLGWLAFDATDESMPYIAAMPRLRFLGCQDTTAGDDGFAALSRSRSLEYIWGRRCHNLKRRGFTALADMPALRGLSVSCKNVDDVGVSALPRFPALKELMPMDVPDDGYRHIGKCEQLQSLVLMYCRDTTDVATEHIVDLPSLTNYFNSYTTITDRTPELLSSMNSLERVTFDTCHGLTNAGIATMARLPKLKEVRASGRGITADVAAVFPAGVAVSV